MLLNDWGVHHLHLTTMHDSTRFVARADYLLFAVFAAQDAYLIDIFPHNDRNIWVYDRVMEIIVREWPTIGVVKESVRAYEHPSLSAQQRRNLREAHLNVPVIVDGKTYYPTGGLTLAGGSSRCTLFVNRVFNNIKSFENLVQEVPDYIVTMLKEQGYDPPPHPDIHFAFFQEGSYGIVETHTGARFVWQE